MSVELCVFVHGNAMPSCDEWQSAIRLAGHDLVFEPFSTIEHFGFLPMTLSGESWGFEYFYGPIDHEWNNEQLRGALEDRSHIATFTFHGSELDLRASEIASSVLAELTDGIYLDPQSGSYARGSAAIEMLANEREPARKQKIEQAEAKWSTVTKRRCPQCTALCPEYRKSCWVCSYELGRE
mgnify:CR=1 FL=1